MNTALIKNTGIYTILLFLLVGRTNCFVNFGIQTEFLTCKKQEK